MFSQTGEAAIMSLIVELIVTSSQTRQPMSASPVLLHAGEGIDEVETASDSVLVEAGSVLGVLVVGPLEPRLIPGRE